MGFRRGSEGVDEVLGAAISSRLSETAALETLTLAGLLQRAAELWPDDPALSFHDGTQLTFGELDRRVGACRSVLREAGFRPGDKIGLMMANSPSYPVAWLAVCTAGGVAVPINKRAGTRDAGYVLEHSGCSSVVCDASTAPTLAEAAGERNLDLRLVNAEDMASAEWSPPATDLYPGTTANIQYTSGTTGFPKGCLLTHRYWVQMGIGASELIGITKEDRVVTAQPHSYIDPQWNVVVSLLMGCELLILDGFHPSTFMRDVAKHRITVFYCLGVMPTLLLKQPPSAHDRNHALRAVHCSAIPLDKHAEIETRFRAPWFEAFGMTETGINSGVLVKDHDELVGTGCIGNPTSYNEVAVLDGEGRELGPRMKGELVFRGKGFMNGYFRDPEATSTFFKDGWAHTGDLAELDEEGRIYFRGRLKEMIRRGGENIAPGEIEEAVSSHPSVLECAVRGVPDPDFEEEIKAYVVLNEGKSLSAEDLIAYLTGRLARFKVPRYIEFRKDLPHTPSERVAKHLLEKDAESWRLNTVDMRDQNTRSQRTTE